MCIYKAMHVSSLENRQVSKRVTLKDTAHYVKHDSRLKNLNFKLSFCIRWNAHVFPIPRALLKYLNRYEETKLKCQTIIPWVTTLPLFACSCLPFTRPASVCMCTSYCVLVRIEVCMYVLAFGCNTKPSLLDISFP